ncbi:sigma-70 family RNA polymerase sigma factor [Maritalea mediterranea]|uniref:RNA polymerase sigma factor n=1 Tax=Maritalea mediterranea TaxID=2909667 RepID=A0ABS9E4V6_9HYPH|nr:sigma-70 family RNA polymerase sigma factor [Maritalea mediterranea]MCF4096929.1 sigma-70 family RNA polymerase sigma factor [Maritalea mediterranea]
MTDARRDISAKTLEYLIGRTALGDKKAFAELYSSMAPKLFGVCFRILRDKQEAEDVLQDAFVKIWQKADRYAQGRATPVAWLSTIVRNQAIDRVRMRGKPTEQIDDHFDLPDKDPTPEQHTISGQVAKQIDLCLEELKQDHAQCVRRTYLGGWSYQQAADELKVPINTVKTWIRRSLLSLKECLGNE